MKHLFVPYEIALQLKEKGFDESCFGWYSNKKLTLFGRTDASYQYEWINAPLYQQVIDWFREKHNIPFAIIYGGSCVEVPYYEILTPKIHLTLAVNNGDDRHPKGYYNYYTALNKAIEEALKLI